MILELVKAAKQRPKYETAFRVSCGTKAATAKIRVESEVQCTPAIGCEYLRVSIYVTVSMYLHTRVAQII